MAKSAGVKVRKGNPGILIEITDELFLQLFTDVAACKTQTEGLGKKLDSAVTAINTRIDTLWKVMLAALTGATGMLGVIIVLANKGW
jgi:hypothetical protein